MEKAPQQRDHLNEFGQLAQQTSNKKLGQMFHGLVRFEWIFLFILFFFPNVNVI